MNRHWTAILIAILAVMLSGIVMAVFRLYRPSAQEGKEQVTGDYTLLKAVPMDAVAVFSFDGSRASRRVTADSTGLLATVLPREIMPVVQQYGALPMALSLHNSGMLVPLAVLPEEKVDTLILPDGLKSARKDGLLLISPSETLLGASQRHLEEGMSVLSTEGLIPLCNRMGGGATLLLSHQQSAKILQLYTAPRIRKHASFLKQLADWTAFRIQVDDMQVSLEGSASSGGSHQSFLSAFDALQTRTAEAPSILPYDLLGGIFLPIGEVRDWIDRRRDFEDAWGRVRAFDREVHTSRNEQQGTPAEWAQDLRIAEVDKVTLREGGSVVVLKVGKDLKPTHGALQNPWKGYVEAIFGDSFAVNDSLYAVLPGKWMVLGSAGGVEALLEKPGMSLKDRLDDARLGTPAGIAVYGSLTDRPELSGEFLALGPARGVDRFVTGAAFAPFWASLELASGTPQMRVSLSRRMEKGEKLTTFLKDTTVIVPTGLFPVQNSQTGQTNYLYQNEVLSICLKDENGKGVWGIPFKQPLCGAVSSIDYFQNGKYQFLFASGSSLYLLDRLGRFVKGFPVDLKKEIRLGPKVFDLSGVGGYNVLVLHKDNTLEMYNLHGQKPSGWKGITSGEVIRTLPEMVLSGGKHYWLVTTSGGDLLYEFYGGEPLKQREMNKILKTATKTTQP